MSLFLFLIVAGVVAWLWRRVDRLERELTNLRGGATSGLAAAAAPAAPLGIPQAGASAASVTEPATVKVSAWAGQAAYWRPRFDFEDLFGRLLPIWAGGVTLAVAGFFLVRWSIDAGLLTPSVRVALAGLFGVALIGAAEAAYRWRERVADPRVSQALAGAGLATLYAAFYLAGSAYGLIGTSVAFLGLAGVTAAAIALSYRFGLPSAVLGLVGGFAAPALVGSEQANLPLLTLYLALVTAGLALTGRRQDRAWLGVTALAAGLGWGALLTSHVGRSAPDVAVLGAYLVTLGAIVPTLVGAGQGRPHWLVRVGAAALAAVQLAVLVQGHFGALEWSLYLLLGAALAWFGWRQPAMREANAAAAAVGVALLFLWGEPNPQGFALVCAALAAIFAVVPLGQTWRAQGRMLDLAQASGVALGLATAVLWHFGSAIPASPQPLLALALLALACIPAAAIGLSRKSGEAPKSPRSIAIQAIAALLGFGAIAQVVAEPALAWFAAALAGLVAWRARSFAGVVATLAVIATGWALEPLFVWLQAGALALVGTPMATVDLPPARTTALYVLPAVVAGAAWSVAAAPAGTIRRIVGTVTIAIAAIAGHVIFRHAFAALAGSDFVTTAVAERAVWQAILLAAAWVAWRRAWPKVAVGLAVTALAHFVWFSLGLNNPLWSAQAVGVAPVVNLLLPAYAVGLAVLVTLRRWLPRELVLTRWAIDGATMATIALLALSELRQGFAGSLLGQVPVGQGEDLLRSLVGVVLGVGLLVWGARTHERSWRIGSLVLMVIAVLKVFLVDAAGLQGLGRIASFMALGFSLIGIGWFYARQLRAPVAPAEAAH
jgi:uncharacterized membrane protein